MRNMIFLSALMICLTGMRMHYPVLPSFKAKIVKKGDAVYIKATITNNTADTLKLMTMSCKSLFRFDTERKIYTGPAHCDFIVPDIKVILPFKSNTELIELKAVRGENLHDLHFRMGFRYLPVKKMDDVYNNFSSFRENKDIIWNDETLYVK